MMLYSMGGKTNQDTFLLTYMDVSAPARYVVDPTEAKASKAVSIKYKMKNRDVFFHYLNKIYNTTQTSCFL